jgi:hypothetical protein
MSVDTIRAALVAMIERVPLIGQVHDYQRYAREEADFRRLYEWQMPSGDLHLRGWQISHVACTERTLGIGRVLKKHTWRIRGYLGLNDGYASEKVFDGLCEAIAGEYRLDETLGGTCTAEAVGEDDDGVQKLDAAPVLFCGVLCHSATLELRTWEYV